MLGENAPPLGDKVSLQVLELTLLVVLGVAVEVLVRVILCPVVIFVEETLNEQVSVGVVGVGGC